MSDTKQCHPQVFELQTAALRYELGQEHSFEFIEGSVPHSMPIGIENLSDADSECFAYYEPGNPASFRKAMKDLELYITSEGPFDGIFAFSQGTSLAAALVLETQQRQSDDRHRLDFLPLRCVVFFAGRLPFIDAGPPHTRLGDEALHTMGVIRIPTTHVWGLNDEVEQDQHAALFELCEGDCRHVFIHDKGHEIPGSKDKDAVTNAANAIKAMLAGIVY